MICNLSCSRNKELWLLVRNTKYPLEIKYFLELWSWPFNANTPKVIEFGKLNISGAAISPNGEMAALATHDEVIVYGFKEAEIIASFKRKGGGTGSDIFWFDNNQSIAFNTSIGFSVVSLVKKENELVFLHKYPASLNYSSELKLLAISTWEKGSVERHEKFT